MNTQSAADFMRTRPAVASIQHVIATREGFNARRSLTLDGLDAHFLLDRDLRVLGQDEDAVSVANCSWSAIRIAGQRVELDDPRGSELLHAYVHGAEQFAQCGVDLPLGHPNLRARLVALRRCAGTGSRATYLLHVTCPRRSTNFVAMGMRLRLTPAEAGLVAALCEGESLVAHAKRRCIAASTARSQMKSAMRKLGVHSQMAAVLLMLRIANAKD